MNKKRRTGKFKGTPIIYAILIVFLGLMGVCYGAWTEGLSIDTTLTTGNTGTRVTMDDRDLTIDISDDGRLVYLDGEIYRDSSKNIGITVKNTGTILLVLNKIEEVIPSEISELDKEGNEGHSLSVFSENDVIDNFNLRISAFERDEGPMGYRLYSNISAFQEDDGIQGKINVLESEIRELEAEIARLSKVKSHNFKYILHFIQGI